MTELSHIPFGTKVRHIYSGLVGFVVGVISREGSCLEYEILQITDRESNNRMPTWHKEVMLERLDMERG